MQINKISNSPVQRNQAPQPNFKGSITIVPLNKETALNALCILFETVPELKQPAQAFRNLGYDDYRYFFISRFKKGFENSVSLFKSGTKNITEALSNAADNLESITLFTNTKCGTNILAETNIMEKLKAKDIPFEYNDFEKEGKGCLISEVPKYKDALAEIFANS